MKKTDLIQKLKSLDSITPDEKAFLINLVNTKKKYGLVWEDKPEDVEELLRENLPVLKEFTDKRILAAEVPKKKNEKLFDEEEQKNVSIPNHVLIEGDNLHALTALTFTHEGRIDVIYIDPPYNTGKKNEFRYNDSWIDMNSPFRHSSWLSFISKRLKIIKRLMSENSAIFISIDHNEFAQLKMLCDDIFQEQNFFGSLIWRKKEGGGQTDAYFVTEHEYILCYKKGDFQWIDDSEIGSISSYNREDKVGKFKLVRLEKWGSGARKEDRPTMHFALTAPDGSEVYPKAPDGNDGRFRVGLKTMNEIIDQSRLHWEKKERWIPYEKIYYNPDKSKTIKARSILYKLANTGDGTNELTDIFSQKDVFENPKPTVLIDFIISHSSDNNSLILDFFAGSGTTLHATMQLNAEDGGNRQCILVTNNENNIAEEVCYERNKRVIEGYKNAKGENVAGLANNNLRYYKSEFVSREPSLKNKRELTRLATELLCIKEDCYTECTSEVVKKKSNWLSVFTNGNGQFLFVIYDDEKIEEGAEALQKLIATKKPKQQIKVYVFSNGQYPYTEEFEEVLPHITLCALPEAIYKAYMNVLPKRKRQQVPELEEATAEIILETDINLFNQEK